jgi:hypothetical protein
VGCAIGVGDVMALQKPVRLSLGGRSYLIKNVLLILATMFMVAKNPLRNWLMN